MGGCIEMKGIHHILHTLDRALCHDINILVPMRTAHQDDIIRIILSDFRDDGFSVYLQVFPFILYRFIVEFVKHMRIFTILLRHFSEEGLSLGCMHLVCMPVDNHVGIILDGSIYHLGNAFQSKVWIFQIVVVNLNPHGSSDDVGMPVLRKPFYRLFVVEPRPDVVPSQTHTSQHYRVTTLVAKLRTFYLQLSPLFYRVCCIHLRHTKESTNEGH